MINQNTKISLDQAYTDSSRQVTEILRNNHGILGQAVNYLAGAAGKGIRARLLLECAVNEQKQVPLDACKAAAAVEIFHLATLVHDDVIDDADTRRGMPSVQSEFGKKQAVITGDYLLALSFSLLSEIERERLTEDYVDVLAGFVSMTKRICTGEYHQLVHSYDINTGYKDYYRTISGKTAALFWIAAYMGAALGGDDEQEARKTARFGQTVGLVFQILDDCKDYEMTEKQALKPVRRDLQDGVITLPLILAMAKKKTLREDVKRVFDGTLPAAAIIEQVKQSGGLAASRALSRTYFIKATKLLEKLDSEVKRSVLLESLHQLFPALAVSAQEAGKDGGERNERNC